MIGKEIRTHRGQVEVRQEEGKPTIISGLASVFFDGPLRSEAELGPGLSERIMSTAFDEALSRQDDTRALFNHDGNNVLGRTKSNTLTLRKTPEGLAYDIELGDTQIARDVAEHIRRGDVSGSSFAFIPDRVTWLEEDNRDIRQIDSVRLFDVGPVTFPAYEDSTTSVRNHESLLQELRAWKEEREVVRKERLKKYFLIRRQRLDLLKKTI